MKPNILKISVICAALAAASSFVSCSCGSSNGSKNGDMQQNDSLKTALEMERQKMEEPMFDIVTNMGTMRIKLYSKTPKHRENFVKLVAEHYYDSLLFHRVIDGFMIQVIHTHGTLQRRHFMDRAVRTILFRQSS